MSGRVEIQSDSCGWYLCLAYVISFLWLCEVYKLADFESSCNKVCRCNSVFSYHIAGWSDNQLMLTVVAVLLFHRAFLFT